MNNLVLHIANTDDSFNESLIKQIENACRIAEDYTNKKFKFRKNVEITFTNNHELIIPETHVGGTTRNDSNIEIAIDPCSEITTGNIFQMICHELCHAVRWQNNDEWSSTLFDGMIFEGLATAFQYQAAIENGFEPDYFLKYITEKSNDEINRVLKIIEPQLNDTSYNYQQIFFDGNKDLNIPRWTGYLIGLYLVNKYAIKNNVPVNELFDKKYSDFRLN